jgi:hypothetical protein
MSVNWRMLGGAERFWRMDDGLPALLCGAGHAGPRHNDNQVPSPPSLLKVRHQSFRLCDQPVLFWSDWGKSSSREIGRIFEQFLHFLGQAYRAGDPLGRLASEAVLGLSKARVSPALGQELPGDSSHQARGGQDCDVGPLTKRSLVFVEVPEVAEQPMATKPPRQRPSEAICCNVVAVCLEKSYPHCCGWKGHKPA